MLLLHEVRHQRLRNRIILAVAPPPFRPNSSASRYTSCLWFPSLPFSATTLIEHCFLTPARGAI